MTLLPPKVRKRTLPGPGQCIAKAVIQARSLVCCIDPRCQRREGTMVVDRPPMCLPIRWNVTDPARRSHAALGTASR